MVIARVVALPFVRRHRRHRPMCLMCVCLSVSQENQKDLERCTEVLSEYLERDITQENLVDIKQKVQDKYR